MTTRPQRDGSPRKRPLHNRVGLRLGVAALVGLIAASVAPALHPGLAFAVLTGWVVFAVVFIVWSWTLMRRLDENQTRAHVQLDDPSAPQSHVLVLLASVASLAGVGFLLAAGKSHGNGIPEATLGAGSIAASWLLVHLTYTLRYAREYYGDGPGAHGIDFSGEEPDYYDFAYVAFDLGMTYQISDTNLKNRYMRRIVLGHTLLSYLLGVGVVATAINLVVSLAG